MVRVLSILKDQRAEPDSSTNAFTDFYIFTHLYFDSFRRKAAFQIYVPITESVFLFPLPGTLI